MAGPLGCVYLRGGCVVIFGGVAAVTGYMQKAIAWQLLEHGVLTHDELVGLIDNTPACMTHSIHTMRKQGLLAPADSSHRQPSVNRKVYGLTRKGIELAMELQASDLSGLRKPSDPLFKQPRRSE